MGFGLPHASHAGGWVYKERDRVSKGQHSLNLVGTVDWYSASDNGNHRYLAWNVSAYQATRQYRPMCIGIQMVAERRQVSTTTGGEASVGWSLTGPSAAGAVSYSRTTGSGTTSDGFYWVCPRGNYVTNTARGGFAYHPAMGGKIASIGVVGCLAFAPERVNERWCTAWDVNRFGGN